MKNFFPVLLLVSVFAYGQIKAYSVGNPSIVSSSFILNSNFETAHEAMTSDTFVSAKRFTTKDIYASSFGFLPSATAAQNTKAMQRISDLINGLSGGVTLHVEKGNYTVGKESFAGTTGKGYSYIGQRLLDLHGCTKPVVIDGQGATIRLANGMHYGSFNPVTGIRHDAPGGGFTVSDYRAYPCTFFWFENNKSVEIKNLVLDGNSENLVIGGYWGDQGIQLEADGVLAYFNGSTEVRNVVARHFARDGLMVGNAVSDTTTIIKYITINNFTADGNGRQGFSWTGGNHLSCVNSSFVNTGQTVNVNSGKHVYSPPGAGIDVEAELGLIKNGVFDNIYIDNQYIGVGFVNDGAVSTSDLTIRNSKIIGTNGAPLYGLSKRMLWENCTIVGSSVSFFTAGSTGPDDPNNATFNKCLFTMDTTASPSGQVYGIYVLDLGGGGQANFRNCTFNSAHRGTIYGGYGFSFFDCVFLRDSAKSGVWGTVYSNDYMNGRFYGVNKKVTPYPEGKPHRSEGSKLNGPFYENGIDVRNIKPGTSRKAAIQVRPVAGGYEATYNDCSKETIKTAQMPISKGSSRKQAL